MRDRTEGGDDGGGEKGDLDQISLGEGAVCLAMMNVMERDPGTGELKQQDNRMAESDIPQLQEEWVRTCEDMFINQPDELPPLREINHRIPLIDESKGYHH